MTKLLGLLAIIQVLAHPTWVQAEPSQRRLVADSRMEKDCKSGGGLLGAMNCITKRIEGATESNKKPNSASATNKETGITTKSVQNPDSSRTITKADKDGNVLSSENKGKSPVSATATDVRTGITTKSVRNPDGTRTVTKTDKDGNILSRERIAKSQASASSTIPETGQITTSVANPDGSRTVTTTDKSGSILSREIVR